MYNYVYTYIYIYIYIHITQEAGVYCGGVAVRHGFVGANLGSRGTKGFCILRV